MCVSLEYVCVYVYAYVYIFACICRLVCTWKQVVEVIEQFNRTQVKKSKLAVGLRDKEQL